MLTLAESLDRLDRDQPPPEAVVLTASAFAAAGQLRDAIHFATAANKLRRDPVLEHRLVGWRHHAAQKAPAGPAAPRPLDPPDLFPGIHGLPEVSAADFTVEVVSSAVLRHGGLIVRGLLGPDEAARLTSGVNHAFDAAERAKAGAPLAETLPWYAPLRPADATLAKARHAVERWKGALCTTDSPRMLFDLLAAFEKRGVSDVAERFLGERPVIAAEKATLRRVSPGTLGDWHQDGRFLGRDIRALNVWVALTECGRDAPSMDIVARRLHEIVTTGDEGANRDWTVGHETAVAAAEGAPMVCPVFQPGDAAVFDHLLLHRTAGRPEQVRSRWALETWFFGPSAMPNYHGLVV